MICGKPGAPYRLCSNNRPFKSQDLTGNNFAFKKGNDTSYYKCFNDQNHKWKVKESRQWTRSMK